MNSSKWNHDEVMKMLQSQSYLLLRAKHIRLLLLLTRGRSLLLLTA